MKINSATLKITQDIIDRAIQRNSKKCMLAIAVREQIFGSWSIDVAGQLLRFNVDQLAHFFILPAIGAKALQLFDTDRSLVKPFKMVIQDPACKTVSKRGPRKPSGRIRKPKDPNRPKNGWTNRRYHVTGQKIPA